MITTLIAAHDGRVTGIRADEAYRFVTVAFDGNASRQAFLTALPRGTSWERGDEVTVTLHLPMSEPFELNTEAKPTAAQKLARLQAAAPAHECGLSRQGIDCMCADADEQAVEIDEDVAFDVDAEPGVICSAGPMLVDAETGDLVTLVQSYLIASIAGNVTRHRLETTDGGIDLTSAQLACSSYIAVCCPDYAAHDLCPHAADRLFAAMLESELHTSRCLELDDPALCVVFNGLANCRAEVLFDEIDAHRVNERVGQVACLVRDCGSVVIDHNTDGTVSVYPPSVVPVDYLETRR